MALYQIFDIEWDVDPEDRKDVVMPTTLFVTEKEIRAKEPGIEDFNEAVGEYLSDRFEFCYFGFCMRKVCVMVDNPELVGLLMDQVEDFLSERSVTLPLAEKDKRRDGLLNGGDDSDVVLYGSDYDDLAQRLRGVLEAAVISNSRKEADA